MSVHDRLAGSAAKLAELIEPCPGWFFVNIGANDGVSNDPIWPLARRHGWSGLAVEPHPDTFAKLQANYADMAGVTCVQAAVSDRPLQLWTVDHPDPERQAAARQASSLSHDYTARALSGLQAMGMIDGGSLRAVDVDCVTFADLMLRHGVERVDLLNIDAEGADADIFASIDLGRFRPRVVICETHRDLPDAARLVGLLEAAGYSQAMVFDWFSTVWVDQAGISSG